MTVNKKKLGRKIKDIRIESDKVKRGLKGKKPTLENFSKLLDSNKSNVLRWENGENIPNEITLRKIAEYGNTTVDWLLGKQVHENGLNQKNKTLIEKENKKYHLTLKHISDSFSKVGISVSIKEETSKLPERFELSLDDFSIEMAFYVLEIYSTLELLDIFLKKKAQCEYNKFKEVITNGN